MLTDYRRLTNKTGGGGRKRADWTPSHAWSNTSLNRVISNVLSSLGGVGVFFLARDHFTLGLQLPPTLSAGL